MRYIRWAIMGYELYNLNFTKANSSIRLSSYMRGCVKPYRTFEMSLKSAAISPPPAFALEPPPLSWILSTDNGGGGGPGGGGGGGGPPAGLEAGGGAAWGGRACAGAAAAPPAGSGVWAMTWARAAPWAFQVRPKGWCCWTNPSTPTRSS